MLLENFRSVVCSLSTYRAVVSSSVPCEPIIISRKRTGQTPGLQYFFIFFLMFVLEPCGPGFKETHNTEEFASPSITKLGSQNLQQTARFAQPLVV